MTLYIIATPIGNLNDITYRAVETLKKCDLILCEDTRHSAVLLKHYEVQAPLRSYHKFKEASIEEELVEKLQGGMFIGLISDAGTPAICDPGARLVRRCVSEGILVVPIPGPCALVHGLVGSGLDTERFQFIGFLPKKERELCSELERVAAYGGTTICYESPRRLSQTLSWIHKRLPTRQVVVARELTKKFEEFCRGTAEELLQRWKESPPKGEVTLLIEGSQAGEEGWNTWTPLEHVSKMEELFEIPRKEAIKLVAGLRDLPKRELYQLDLDHSETE